MSLQGRRVLITGAARGIGALAAKRLHAQGARVALLGLEPDLLEQTAAECGGAAWQTCDVSDREQVDAGVEAMVAALGGLDVAYANAGVAAQLPIIGGDPKIFETTMAVNTLGTYYFVRAAGPHISHPNGYALLTASLAARVHLPLISAYCASKAAVEALGNALALELRPAGAKVGIAFYAELKTDMTSRGFSTEAAKRLPLGGHGHLPVSPVEPAIAAVVKAIDQRSPRVVSPSWIRFVMPFGGIARRAVALQVGEKKFAETLEIARREHAQLTTEQR